eukprot:TRINITY_DN1759_c2_g2_i1.p1 TRINITY_DN1759_c2_g2~~TRINITY_DN1759_c2_g2_i1.p1  ORF type:complete len:637 (+),score=266.81 TRINITY_DN1759_c2_g2_i1:96-2006(+)
MVVHEHLVQSSLDLMMYDNAVFYAERLFAAEPLLKNLHLLATTHVRSHDIGAALRVLQHHFPFNEFHGDGGAPPGEADAAYLPKLSYLYGVCLAKTDRWQEAEVVLKYVQGGTGAEASAAEYWMGEIFKRTNRESAALGKYGAALRLSPFNWAAAARFAELNHPPSHSSDDRRAAKANAEAVSALFADDAADHWSRELGLSISHAAPPPPHPADQTVPGGSPASLAPPDVSPISSAATTDGPAAAFTPAPGSTLRPGNAATRPRPSPGSEWAPRPAPGAFFDAPMSAPPGKVREECARLLTLLRGIFQVARKGAEYDAAGVVQRLQELPLAQRKSAYLQSLLAKAYYDEGRHAEAVQVFESIRRGDPHRLDPNFMLYSSCLWQLQCCKKLAHLAQEMVQVDKLSLVTQVVMGNTHSIVGEHEAAIQLFSRGYAIDKHNPYASTLKGMEHLVLDELDDARQAFRTSLRVDSRHYPAWHGLGSVAAKQEKWHDAVVYFRMASTINPNPPLLLAYAGALMEEGQKGSLQSALTAIEKVLRKCPGHELARLKLGEVYLKDGRLQEARHVALKLHEIAPRESKVNLLLARVSRKLGDRKAALQHCTNALGLDPKDTPAVTYEMERAREGAVDSDDDDDDAP